MINKETIDKIVDTARIEDVVGEFVTLKKRGSNLLGNCPFHNEKTPSFTVSPAKGIYKCFGCGKAGNSVNFIMDHEQLNYPEALRYLAKKYHIEIAEEVQSSEQKEIDSERESLFVICSFAQKHFTHNLHNVNEGKAIGLSYFKERGFRQDIIEKFQLGYSLDKWTGFTDAALEKGYNLSYLEKAGLTIVKENEIFQDANQPEKEAKVKAFDRFMGRVIFPVHNLTGRVIAFGGRTLKSDKKVAKYINSPETPIYHKSNVLYGAYFAKKTIIAEDRCYLVEGYTDVISMHQAGIENVVASSGTSLTIEQIRLIHRFTKNITILYDGDPAGIKASFRGIDMILEEGMNVKVLLFPDGEDPDSFSKKVSSQELKSFIAENSKDFIAFKTNLLYAEAAHDPIKRADLIKDILQSISIIPEAITRSLYVKQCSQIMDMDEQVLLHELNKFRKKKTQPSRENENRSAEQPVEEPEESKKIKPYSSTDTEPQERDIIRILLNFGDVNVKMEAEDEDGSSVMVDVAVADIVKDELVKDEITFNNPTYQKVFEEACTLIDSGEPVSQAYFLNNPDSEVRNLAIDLVSSPYSLSENWEKHGIYVQTETMQLKSSALHAIYSLKLKKVEKEIMKNEKQMKENPETVNEELLKETLNYIHLKKVFSKLLGRIIIK